MLEKTEEGKIKSGVCRALLGGVARLVTPKPEWRRRIMYD